MPTVRVASSDEPLEVKRPLIGYFYVPPACKVVGGYISSKGALLQIFDDSNKLVYELKPDASEYFSVEVPKNQQGKTWKIYVFTDNMYFLTVPPYIARTPQELLVPSELVQAKTEEAPAKTEDTPAK